MTFLDPSPVPGTACGTLSPAARSLAFERAHAAQTIRRRSVRRRSRKPQAPVPKSGFEPKNRSPRQRVGHAYEQRAARHLESAGLQLLACNVHARCGEIDLIAMDGAVLVFVEVRARARGSFGGAAASVTRAKQRRLIRTATCLLPTLRRHLVRAGQWNASEGACRFDVVAFESDTVQWIKQAFTATL